MSKPKIKQTALLKDLRKKIRSGRYAPGDLLPSRREMIRNYGLSLITVETVIDELIKDGFLVAEAGRGTFVPRNPPHLCRYALVFYEKPDGEEYYRMSRFNRALLLAAEKLSRPNCIITPYFGLDGHIDTDSYQKLLKEIERGRLAGIIYASNPYRLLGSPVLDKTGCPRVGIMSKSGFGMPAVSIDVESFIGRAREWLCERGCRRIASINHERAFSERNLKQLYQMFSAGDFETKAYWHQFCNHVYPDAASCLIQLLLQGGKEPRPDALIITDDNIAEGTLIGIKAAGMKVPEDIEVVMQCNFPLPPETSLPVKKIGFDLVKILEICLMRLAQQRKGEDAPPITSQPALTED
jgi:hypothetical protein